MVVALRVAAVGVLFAGAIALVTYKADDAGPPHPKDWDPRVLDLVHFAEEHRALKFKEPVFVDFLDAAAYSERIRTDESTLTDEDRAAIDTTLGELRALGLVTGDIDLFGKSNELVDTGSLAFYSPDTERITVRGTEMTVGLRVTLAHELTHALQDQHFTIGRKRTSKFTTSQEATAFRAMLEGDATRIENEFIEGLAAEDKQAYFAERDADSANASAGLSSVPAALQAFQFAPYAFGPPLVELLDAEGNDAKVDDALRDPPVSEQQLVDARVYESGIEPLEIDDPFLRDGVAEEAETDSGDLGWVTWYVFLAERIDPVAALQAADGWGGDAYVAFAKDGKTCMNIVWQGATSTDLQEMQAAMTQWVAAMPPGAATVTSNDQLLFLAACDPGAESGITINDRAIDVIQIPAARSQLTLEAVRDGDLPVEKAFVVADCVVRSIPFDQWAAVNSGELSSEDFGAQISSAIAPCLAG